MSDEVIELVARMSRNGWTDSQVTRLLDMLTGPVDVRAYAQELGTQCALDERARIVAWLRSGEGDDEPKAWSVKWADAIERGEHTKVTQCAGCGHPLGDMGCCDLCDDEDAPSTS